MYSSTLPSLFLPASKNTAWWGLHLGEIVGNGLKKDLLLLKSLLCFGWMNGCISTAPWPSIKWKCGRWRFYSHTCSCKRKGSLTFETETNKAFLKGIINIYRGQSWWASNTISTVFKIFCVRDMLTIVCWVAPSRLATVSNLKTRPSLPCSSTVAAVGQ